MNNPATPRLSRPQIPETPPASTTKRLNGPLPVFAIPNKTPKTQKHKQLETPATNVLKRPVDLLPPPVSAALPLLPQFTPHRSPHLRRRRVVPGEFFTLNAISTLLPSGSTVSDARKPHKSLKCLKAPFLLGDKELKPLATSFAVSEDVALESENESENSDTDFESAAILNSPSKKPRDRKPKERNPVNPVDFFPSTPRKQVITEEKVKEWQVTSSGLEYPTVEDWNEAKKELINPFVESSSTEVNVSSKSTPARSRTPINYDTHMELVNHRTGERKIEAISPSRRQLRPRRIDFSQM